MSSSGHDSTAQSQASTNTRGKTDVAWNHCSEGRATDGKRILTCLYCQKAIKGGGINRVKQHLAGKKGEVGLCRRVPPDVKHEMEQSLKNIEQNKKEKVDMRSFDDPYEGVDVDVEEIICQSPSDNVPTKGKEKKLGNFFTSKPQPEKQPTIKSAMAGKEAVWRENMAVARWFYDCCIPFNAVNSIYFQPMFDAAIRVGLGYRVPSYHDVRVNLLRDSKKEVTLFVETMRSFWGDCGCTIMGDGWTDGRHRSLINFLVYCPRGICFVKSVDASDAVKNGKLLAKLFIDVIEWVGPTNVFHMVTDNGANYVLAGKLVSEQYKNISWSPCAAHCLNLILGDIAKMNHIVELAKKASKITKFIYNHGWLLAWLRKRKDWIEIIRPGPTRFATTFIALHNVYDHMHDLQALVTSKDFKESRYAKEAQGKVVVSYILNKNFWNDCLIVTKIVEPLMRVLRIVDMDERPSIAYLYDGMFRARKAIKKVFRQKKSLYKPYTNIIKERWDKQLRKSVHAAAYWLNPCFQYNQESFCGKPEVMAGLLDVIEAKATTSKVKLLEETRIYRERMGSFGRELALTTSKTTQPDEWWRLFGSSAPNLQKLAIKVLSQTSSSSGCERNWSVFDRIHTKKRNRLEHQRLNDLVFVHYNLRLKNRHCYKKWNYDPIDYESIGKTEFWIVEDEDEPFLDYDELEKIVYDEGAMPHFERQRRRPREEVNEEEDIVNLDVNDDDDDDDDDVDFTSFTNLLLSVSNPFTFEDLRGHGRLEELGRASGSGTRGLIDEDEDDDNWQEAPPSRP